MAAVPPFRNLSTSIALLTSHTSGKHKPNICKGLNGRKQKLLFLNYFSADCKVQSVHSLEWRENINKHIPYQPILRQLLSKIFHSQTLKDKHLTPALFMQKFVAKINPIKGR